MKVRINVASLVGEDAAKVAESIRKMTKQGMSVEFVSDAPAGSFTAATPVVTLNGAAPKAGS
jgi:predicted amidohydrolase YtcJ